MSNPLTKLFRKQKRSPDTLQLKIKAPSKWQIRRMEKSLERRMKQYNEFLLANNAINIEKTRVDTDKRILKHPLKMEKFDMEYVKRYTQSKLNERLRKAKKPKNPIKPQFGDDKKKAYEFQEAFFDSVVETCRVNKWISRKDWLEHGVPVNKIFSDFYKAAVLFAEVRMYYAKQDFDKRQREYSVIKQ